MKQWLTDLIGECKDNLHSSMGLQARNYLASRNVTEAEIESHDLGLFIFSQNSNCPPDFQYWANVRARDSVVFPVYTFDGIPLGILVRSLTEKSYFQYWAYPSELYSFAFGMKQSIKSIYETQHVVLVEGVFDYFAIKKGSPSCLAMLTAGVSKTTRKFLSRNVKYITGFFDMDPAGREACKRLEEYFPMVAINCPNYRAHDPSDLLKQSQGLESIKRGCLATRFNSGNRDDV